MDDLRKVYGKRNALIVFVILLLLMVVGSFADYQFSLAVHNEQNAFGIALAAFGEAPAMLGLAVSGLLLILGRNKDRKAVGIFQLIAGILLLVLGGIMAIYMPGRYLSPAIVAYIIGIVLFAATVFAVLRLVKNAQRETMIKVALAIVLVVVAEMIVINIIKIPWGRPRMRLIAVEPQAYFTSWWVAGSALKDKLTAVGIASEEFKSFPSGHTANGAAAMLLPLLALLGGSLKKRGSLLLCAGAAWGLLVALSRIIMGAHFITDTVVGFAITFAIILVVVHLVFLRNKEKIKSKNVSARKELKQQIVKSVAQDKLTRREWKAQLAAMPSAEKKAEKAKDKAAKKAAKKERKAEVKAMPKPDKKSAKRHDRIYKKVYHRPRRGIIWAAVLCLVVFGVYQLAPIVGGFMGLTSISLDSQTPEGDTARAAAVVVAEEISDEGIVLLKNDNTSLPLSEKKLNVFGTASFAIRYGGGGSGGADASAAVNLYDGLKSAGIEYNEELYDLTKPLVKSDGSSNGLIASISAMFLGTGSDEPEANYLTDTAIAQAKEYSENAMIVIASDGVEASDTTPEQLRLTDNKRALVERVAANFDNVIVVINAGNALELGFVDEYPSIKSVLWIGTPGPYGCISLGKVLAGEVNPSGRLVDTYAYDASSNPASVNFGDYDYSNIKGMSFINYEEGIYVGYRFYETYYKGDEAGYKNAVQFPFGYGLSYTDFDWKFAYSGSEDNVKVDVTVTNTGTFAGKDVVQAYFSPPYTEGGIEKSAIELGGYAKTKLLDPGESETVTIEFPVRDMASYDMERGAYVLEEGNYGIYVSRNVHESVAEFSYDVEKTIVFDTDEATGTAIANQFDYANGELTYLSRSDWTGTYPDMSDTSFTASQELLNEYNSKPAAVSGSAPTTGADNGIKLADLKGLDYDDPKWEAFLDQFTFEEMAEFISKGAYKTVAIERLGVPEAIMLDGPAGINSMFSYVQAASYPTAVVIASTWNDDLAFAMGEAVGTEAKTYGLSVWYAPGMNIHRTPQGGRNFEYYSEDPLLSGKMGAAIVSGAQSRDVIVTMKHFALNEQEVNARSGVLVWANEQAIREIYLRPFEITVKEGGATGVMTSFILIGTKWSGGNPELLQNVLRDEWGFRGFVTTDAVLGGFMDVNLSIRNGGGLMLDVLNMRGDAGYMKSLYKEDPTGILLGLRAGTHDVCYSFLNYTTLFD